MNYSKTTTKATTAQAIRDAGINIADEISTTIQNEMSNLRQGDYYGDSLPDALADIAKSLRILSGREELK